MRLPFVPHMEILPFANHEGSGKILFEVMAPAKEGCVTPPCSILWFQPVPGCLFPKSPGRSCHSMASVLAPVLQDGGLPRLIQESWAAFPHPVASCLEARRGELSYRPVQNNSQGTEWFSVPRTGYIFVDTDSSLNVPVITVVYLCLLEGTGM